MRLYFVFCGMCLLWSLSFSGNAEQLRMAVVMPEVVADGEEAMKKAETVAALWQSFMSVELSHDEVFSVLEREQVALLLKEWELAAGGGGAAVKGQALAADCLVLGKLTLKGAAYELALKVVSAGTGAVEKEFEPTFMNPSAVEECAKTVAGRLRAAGLGMLARREIHTVVSVPDFESITSFEKSRWQGRAIARRIRGMFQIVPGVLVLEREDMDMLYQEVRLARGGITDGGDSLGRRWGKLKNYLLFSGTVKESQPEGQQAALRVDVRMRNLSGGGERSFDVTFAVDDMASGMTRVEQKSQELAVEVSGRSDKKSFQKLDRSAEALALAEMAVYLLNSGKDVNSLKRVDDLRWETFYLGGWFSPSKMSFDMSAERRANILSAVRYLKAAVLADDQSPTIKAFLSLLLADKQVNEMPLSIELAEEIGGRYPDYQRKAWFFIYQNGDKEKGAYYRQLLIDKHPGTYEAQLASLDIMDEVLKQHWGDVDVSAGLAEARPYFEKFLDWEKHGSCPLGGVQPLFKFTHLAKPAGGKCKESEMRPVENRLKGEQFIEDMIIRHPRWAYYMCESWTYCWDYFTDRQDMVYKWIRRSSDEALKTDRNPSKIGVSIDPWRIKLAKFLMSEGKHKEAFSYLELVSNYHSVKEAAMLAGQCQFADGAYAEALKRFQELGPDNKEAVAWTAKCRGKLGLPVADPVGKAYTAMNAQSSWKAPTLKLPQGSISVLKEDGDAVWIGLKHQMIWADHNVVMLEGDEAKRKEALRQGGLARLHRSSGKVELFEVGKTISHPWVTSVAVAGGRVWVGTYGGGIDVLDKATGSWTNVNDQNGLPSNYVQCLDADRENLWVGLGRFEAGGVARHNFAAKQWRAYHPSDYPAAAPPPINRISCVKSVDGALWCGLSADHIPGGMTDFIYRYDIPSNTWRHFPSRALITSVAACAGRVWFGANRFDIPELERGLIHCDPSGGDWQTIRIKDGFPDIRVDALGERNGVLAIGGEKALLFLDPVKKDFVVHEWPKDASWVTSMVVLDGTMWMSTMYGKILTLELP